MQLQIMLFFLTCFLCCGYQRQVSDPHHMADDPMLSEVKHSKCGKQTVDFINLPPLTFCHFMFLASSRLLC